MSTGRVRHWSDEHGRGVVDSDDTPGGCWVGLSSFSDTAAFTLTRGDSVRFTAVAVTNQDGYAYRAQGLAPVGDRRPPTTETPSKSEAAYASQLRVDFDR